MRYSTEPDYPILIERTKSGWTPAQLSNETGRAVMEAVEGLSQELTILIAQLDGDRVFYRDDGHVSVTGAYRIVPLMRKGLGY